MARRRAWSLKASLSRLVGAGAAALAVAMFAPSTTYAAVVTSKTAIEPPSLLENSHDRSYSKKWIKKHKRGGFFFVEGDAKKGQDVVENDAVQPADPIAESSAVESSAAATPVEGEGSAEKPATAGEETETGAGDSSEVPVEMMPNMAESSAAETGVASEEASTTAEAPTFIDDSSPESRNKHRPNVELSAAGLSAVQVRGHVRPFVVDVEGQPMAAVEQTIKSNSSEAADSGMSGSRGRKSGSRGREPREGGRRASEAADSDKPARSGRRGRDALKQMTTAPTEPIPPQD